MKHLLQSLLFSRRTYNRPHDTWTCGRACEGCPCALGPDEKGGCRATGECLPAKRGDRWFCTRSEAQGGPCTAGPLPEGACGRQVTPCVPQLSLRAQRGRWTLLAAVAALGLTILALAGRGRPAWINPGPLTAHHATSAQRCADCHLESAGLTLAPQAVALHRLEENHLCLKCHELGPNSNSPHGLEFPPKRATLAAGNAAQPVVLKLAHLLAGTDGETPLACATCHQEHHGRDSNLTRMADNQCQTCHAVQFASLAAGHPEFSNYPFNRRTRIQFDHVSHLEKHFRDPGLSAPPPATCASCHETAVDGARMLVRGFEQTCAQCHSRQIEGEGRSGDKGIAFLRLPGVDVAALTGAGISIGEWPAYCEGHMTPFMRWMLEGNPEDRSALATLGPVSLEDLSSATPEQKVAAGRIVWSIKGLVADLVTQGQLTLLKRMSSGAEARSTVAARTGQFSGDGLLTAQVAWLPHLLEEVSGYRKGLTPPLPVAAASPSAPTVPLATAKDAAAMDDDLLAAPAPAAAGATDDLLAAEPPAPAKPADDLLLDSAPSPPVPSMAAPPAAPTMAMADTEQRVTTGGWYRQDNTYTLFYRPTGHADPFLTSWLEATASGSSPASREIFAELAAPKAPGLCIKCHTIDAGKDQVVVNWHALGPEPKQHPFTRFKHQAHFSVAGDQGCQSCHSLDGRSPYSTAFVNNRDPAVFHGNFSAISRDTCATCHTPTVAGDDCLKCHNYHTGTFEPHMRQLIDLSPPAKRAAD